MSIYKRFKEVVKKNNKETIVYWKEKEKWRDKSYEDFLRDVDIFAEALKKKGILKNDKVAILSENRPEWLLSDLAINKIGAVSVPIHTTSSKSFIEYILEDSESKLLITSKTLFDKNFDLLKNWNKKIIVFDDETSCFDKVFFFSEMMEGVEVIGQGVECAENDLASIIYTSGTTGTPKGVMLTNDNFLSNVESALKIIPIKSTDKFLSFLPLSHVLERMAGSYTPILSGASIAYAESVAKLQENMEEIKPTVLICVPKIFERIYEKIFFKIKESGLIRKKIFFWSLKQKNNNWKKGIAEKLVYAQIRNAFGGNLRFAVSGGASINDRIIKFFNKVNLKIIEGYGLTETAPLISVNEIDNMKIGSVGKLIDGVEVKIAKDKEIMVKGKNVMIGYWNKEDKTREAISKDGWFMTGDLGFLDKDNFLTIIGRKKDIIVLSNGKNIAPEQIEGFINLSDQVDQSLVVGHKRGFLSALITIDKEKMGPKTNSEKFDIIDKEIKKINKKLPHHEQIRKFKILDKGFTIEGEELTPTLKVRRAIIEKKYCQIIDEFYK